MVGYDEKIYPELDYAEFKKHILPIINSLRSLEMTDVFCLENKENKTDFTEKYPYHNSCRFFVDSIWERLWDKRLNDLLIDSHDFKKTVCESLSQIVFSNFIRCFAEQIKAPSIDKDVIKNYETYSDQLIKTNLKYFSKEYPVIWHRCTKVINNKIEFIIMSLNEIFHNKNAISLKFNIPIKSRVKDINMGGDTHNGGKSVAVITFEGNRKIIFKPRSVDGEYGYSELATKMNLLFGTDFQTLEVLKVGSYGFTSFVETSNKDCDMLKAGELACLMFLLNATDMHYSNILWSQNGPIPIDLETLFHVPRIRTGMKESINSAYKFIEQSVYSTGVLPINLTSKNNFVDVGFTGVQEENGSGPVKSIKVVNGFTPDIQIAWSDIENSEKINRNSEYENTIYRRCDNVIEGFSRVYSIIMENKERFIDLVVTIFENAKLRYLHNMTYRYEQILRSLTSPEASRELPFCRSILSRVGILSMSCDKEIAISECQQLWNADIPYFMIDFSGKSIIDSNNSLIAMMEQSPKDRFIGKIMELSNEELEKQIKIIRLSFVAKLSDPHENNLETLKIYSDEIDRKKKTQEDTIKLLSDKLVNSILDDRFSHLPQTWIGPVASHSKNGWAPGVLGYDLYGGRMGCAISLGLAGRVLSNEKYLKAAYQIFNSSANILVSKEYEIKSIMSSGIGAFAGFSSVIWGLYEASYIFEKSDWRDLAIKSWKIVDKELSLVGENFFDMMTGNSAAIVLRLRMDPEYVINNHQIQMYIQAANRFINNRTDKTTTGLAHGLSHLIWFFSNVYNHRPDSRIIGIVNKIIKVIKNEYTSQFGYVNIYCNEDYQSFSWCNGITGVILAYYEGYKVGIISRNEVKKLLVQLENTDISNTPIYCHGVLGVIEVLELIENDFPKQTTPVLSKFCFGVSLSTQINNYFKEEKGRYTLSPGFMSGISGAIHYLCKINNEKLQISPVTLVKTHEK